MKNNLSLGRFRIDNNQLMIRITLIIHLESFLSFLMNEYVNNPANKAYPAKPDCCSTHSKQNSSHKNQVSMKSEIYELQ